MWKVILAYSCSSSGLSTIDSNSGNSPWIDKSWSFIASAFTSTVIFGFNADSNTYYLLDDVSIVQTNNASFQLLNNPSFDDSTTSPVGWSVWCSGTCSGGSGGDVTSSGSCQSSVCYKGSCSGSGGKTDYISQTFSTIVGQNYTISFSYRRIRTSGSPTVILYAAVF